MAQIDELTKDIVELQTQVQSITTMSGKLDTAIEKLTDVSSSIKSMLAVHEEKINRAEDIDDELFSQIESRRRELSSDIKELHSRLNTNTKELRDCISKLSLQLKQQERFKWLLIGGAMAVGFILSNMKILDKLF
jgi:chromosome segregation ATPase